MAEKAFANRIRFGTLYEIYGSLLTPKQQNCLRLYFYEDYTLAEIAVEMNVSRQAVHDLLRRVELTLEHYESLLNVLRSRESDRALWREAEPLLSRAAETSAAAREAKAVLEKLSAIK